MRVWVQFILSIVMLVAAPLHACNCSIEGAKQPMSELIRENGDIVTFFFLIKRAGLEPLLKDVDPKTHYTVFAPTDAAFAKLPPELMTELEEDKSKLLAVLRHHIVDKRMNRAWLQTVGNSKAMSGYDLQVLAQPLSVNNVPIGRQHIPATNGAIHVIDSVLMPPDSIMDALKKRGKYSLFLKAIEKANLSDRLRGIGPFTVFAPTDDALKSNPNFTSLMENEVELRKMLGAHIGLSKNLTQATKGGIVMMVESIDGGRLDFKGVGTTTMVNSAKIIEPDVVAGNGLFHGIDSVIGPLKAAPIVIIPPTPPAQEIATAKPGTKEDKRVREAREKAEKKAAREAEEKAEQLAEDRERAEKEREKENKNKIKKEIERKKELSSSEK